MRREEQVKKINARVKELLTENPEIKEALRVFDISYDQYQKTLQSNYSYYNAFSTSTANAEIKTKHK